ncbi:MAG: RNA-binding protein [Paraglaciecola sp.]|uniref:RNA recognition motif domain-containing protein n=1 Tax=Pseudomonadati TaxID=3379134 RepID=UPI00273E0028|nr:RNA-binding protein [Paraglaciecola sp.]MDP5031388.1 RNA-binding protein [Paraglaciecola sp.]MDP5129920.1 RNA-binding protein [Paraglaciecola sp.]
MKILVRNLDRETTEDELHAAFSAFGKVQSCSIVREKTNGLSKGFGFVELPKPGEAKAAIKQLNDSYLGANKIRVKYAQSLKAETPPEVK